MKPLFPPFDYNNPRAITERLRELLPPEHFLTLEQVMVVAAEMNSPALLVGGIVRDLFLGRQNLDLDFVTLDFSHHLAERLETYFEQHPEISKVTLLKHERFGTARLELVFVSGKSLHIDLATSRRETYAHPAALPTVSIDPNAPIETDLFRRDFTINAMALSLQTGLVDPYGGLDDLREGWLRFLHPGSFTDDPTRMVRGVRYAARFDYRFEPETERALIETVAAGTFNLLSHERKRNELHHILAEIAPERPMRLLHKYGLLAAIHPLLEWDSQVEADFSRIKAICPSVAAYLSALVWRKSEEEARRVVVELNFAHHEVKIPPQVAHFRQETLPELVEGLPDSRLYNLLHKYHPEALEIAAVLAPETGAPVRRYLEVVQFQQPSLDGDFLKQLGLKPGHYYRDILDALREAVQDGKLATVEDEARFLKAKAAEYGYTG